MTGDRSQRVPPKLAVLALVVAALGLPINNLASFGLLVFAVLIVLTGTVMTGAMRWIAAIVVTLLVVGQHAYLSSPRIEEGHNVFLVDRPGGALEKGLPADAFRFMKERFDHAYPTDKRCRENTIYCWRPASLPQQTFALAADGMFDGHSLSRRVTGIDFTDPIWLRLGVVNDLPLDLIPQVSDVQRLYRNRHSLAIFNRYDLRLPFFVMYRLPPEFIGSELCWRGDVLWESAEEKFDRLASAGCRALKAEDAGRRVFGVAIGSDANLEMKLAANWSIKLRRILDSATTLAGFAAILLLLVRWSPRRVVLPAILGIIALAAIVLTDITFIGGYRPFDGGDDGLIFSGQARRMLEAFARGDILGVLEGAEKVYGFTAGMRYFRFAEFLIFGDSYLGYLLLMLAFPMVAYAVARRFLGTDSALAFTFLFVAVPLGTLFGTTYVHYAAWAARGYGDPLGAMLFLGGLILLAGCAGPSFDDRISPAFWGALLMAGAVVMRPNLVMGVGLILGGLAIAALWHRNIARVAALCVGFAPVLFTFWHNWFFGGVIVPLSDNVTAANVFKMSPIDYRDALLELLRFDFAGPHVVRAVRQTIDLLAGPSNVWPLVPLHAAAAIIVFRVMLARRFESMLRLTALATIALVPIGLTYAVTVRYNLVMWFLTGLITFAWIKIEGIALIDHYRPGHLARLAATAPAQKLARAGVWLKRTQSA